MSVSMPQSASVSASLEQELGDLQYAAFQCLNRLQCLQEASAASAKAVVKSRFNASIGFSVCKPSKVIPVERSQNSFNASIGFSVCKLTVLRSTLAQIHMFQCLNRLQCLQVSPHASMARLMVSVSMPQSASVSASERRPHLHKAGGCVSMPQSASVSASHWHLHQRIPRRFCFNASIGFQCCKSCVDTAAQRWVPGFNASIGFSVCKW